MTIEELINALVKYPSGMQVFVRSYEQGYDPLKKMETMSLINNPTDYDWEGNVITLEQREHLAAARGWGLEVIELNPSEKNTRFDGLVLVGDSRSSY